MTWSGIHHIASLTGKASLTGNLFGAIADFSLRFSLQRSIPTFCSDTQEEICSSIQMYTSQARYGGAI